MARSGRSRAAFALPAIALVACCVGGPARAATIQELIDNNNGMITVGGLKFTFDKDSVSGNRNAMQIEVVPVGNNGLEFQLNPIIMLVSNMTAGQTEKVTITYTVMSTAEIYAAHLGVSSFARDTRNGAAAGGTEMFAEDNLMLYQGTEPPMIVRDGFFANPLMMLTVTNMGSATVPVRGPGGQDEAQLRSITNTFDVVPEPASVVLASLGALGVLLRVGFVKVTRIKPDAVRPLRLRRDWGRGRSGR